MKLDLEMFADEIEQAIAHVPAANKNAARTLVKSLLKAAKPGNAAWHKLQNDWNFTGDYCEADAGNAPKGSEW